jgi:hypothetical protein
MNEQVNEARELEEISCERIGTSVEEIENERAQTLYHAIVCEEGMPLYVITEARQKDLLKKLEGIPRSEILKVFKGRELELKTSYGF